MDFAETSLLCRRLAAKRKTLFVVLLLLLVVVFVFGLSPSLAIF
jgi:hypothetical protein